MEDGEAVKAHGPMIVIEFRGEGSSIADLKATGCNYMQLFAAAKLLEIQGETAFMQSQLAAVQADAKAPRLVVPRPRGN